MDIKSTEGKLKIVMIVTGVLLIWSLYWLFVGSFEMFPSDEDMVQGRLYALSLFFLSVVAEGVLYLCRRKVHASSKEESAEAPADE